MERIRERERAGAEGGRYRPVTRPPSSSPYARRPTLLVVEKHPLELSIDFNHFNPPPLNPGVANDVRRVIVQLFFFWQCHGLNPLSSFRILQLNIRVFCFHISNDREFLKKRETRQQACEIVILIDCFS